MSRSRRLSPFARSLLRRLRREPIAYGSESAAERRSLVAMQRRRAVTTTRRDGQVVWVPNDGYRTLRPLSPVMRAMVRRLDEAPVAVGTVTRVEERTLHALARRGLVFILPCVQASPRVLGVTALVSVVSLLERRLLAIRMGQLPDLVADPWARFWGWDTAPGGWLYKWTLDVSKQRETWLICSACAQLACVLHVVVEGQLFCYCVKPRPAQIELVADVERARHLIRVDVRQAAAMAMVNVGDLRSA